MGVRDLREMETEQIRSAPFSGSRRIHGAAGVLVIVAVVAFVVAVGMTVAAIFVFFEAGFVAHFAFMVPLVVVVEMSARAVPITTVVATAFMARSNPVCTHVGWTAPVAFVPAIVAGNRIPIATYPNIVGSGLGGHYNDCARGRRRADLNADGYLSLR